MFALDFHIKILYHILMRNYEISVLVSAALSEEEARAFVEKIASLIKEANNSPVEIRSFSKIRLGYLLKKQREAYFAAISFSAETENLKALKEKLTEESQVLRYQIMVKKPQKEVIPQKTFVAPAAVTEQPILETIKETPKVEKKVELKEIEEKLEEILNE